MVRKQLRRGYGRVNCTLFLPYLLDEGCPHAGADGHAASVWRRKAWRLYHLVIKIQSVAARLKPHIEETEYGGK
jgi:hypothetical protein